MRKHTLLLSLSLGLVLSGCQQPAEKPTAEAEDFKTYSAEEFYRTTSVFGSSINHDQTAVLVSSDESGIFNAYKVALDGSGKEALTHSTDESIFVNSWFPNDDRILYNADQGGNELDHVYVREEDGRVTDLTPGEDLKASFAGWHENDRQFYITSNERNPKFFDLYRYQVDDYSREMIYQNDSGYQLGDISPDGRWLALSKTNSNADSDIYLVDLNDSDAEPQLIAGDAPEDVAHRIYTFTPDSQQLIYGSNANSEFNQAMAYD